MFNMFPLALVACLATSGLLQVNAVDQCCTDEEPVCSCSECLSEYDAELLVCDVLPGFVNDCCPPDEGCNIEFPACSCGECLTRAEAEEFPCDPAPGSDGSCTADTPDEGCTEEFPACSCGECLTRAEAEDLPCEPAPGSDGSCTVDECSCEAGCKVVCDTRSDTTYDNKCEAEDAGAKWYDLIAGECGVQVEVSECCTNYSPHCLCGFCGTPSYAARSSCDISPSCCTD